MRSLSAFLCASTAAGAEIALAEGTYSISSLASGLELHADEKGDKRVSTRWQPHDDYTHFEARMVKGGTYRFSVVADGHFVHAEDLTTMQVDTVDSEDEYTHFMLDAVSGGGYTVRAMASNRSWALNSKSLLETIADGQPDAFVFSSVTPSPRPSPSPRPRPTPRPIPPPPAPILPVVVPASDKAIRYVGRFDHAANAARFDRNGCEILFSTKGATTVSVKMSQQLSKRTQMTKSKPHGFLVYVDGVPQTTPIDGSVCFREGCTFDTDNAKSNAIVEHVILKGLSSEAHDIRILKTSEPEWGAKVPSPNWVQFHGVGLDAGVIASPSSPRRNRRIEFVGDSITAGMCNLCVGRKETGNWTFENFAKSWPTVACEKLGAECSTVAWSGYGLISNCCGKTGSTRMPEIWDRTVATDVTGGSNAWDFSSWIPDALVVNLGTNDQRHANSDGFVKTYVDLVTKAHKFYGNGLNVFLACGPISNKYCNSVQLTVGNATALGIKAHFLDQTHFMNGSFGGKCCGHPSANVDEAMGNNLAEVIASKLGWSTDAIV